MNVLKGLKSLAVGLIIVAPTISFATPDLIPRVNDPYSDELTRIHNQFANCLDKNSSEAGMKQCSSDAYTQVDKVLNDLYTAKVNDLKKQKDDNSKVTLNRLVKSEVAWVQFRDAQCSYEGTQDLGGSNEGLDILACQYEMTKKRVISLHSF